MNMDFDIDFSEIQWIEVRKLGISMDEVYSVFKNPSSSFVFLPGLDFIVGFTSKRKIIVVTYQIAKNVNFDIEVIEIELPYEEDIKRFWCPYNK
jgi:hypothetical protein